MSAFVGRTAAQKEFIKLFDTLTGTHSRWEVWKDMVVIMATAISNAVDKRFFDEREKVYLDTINNRYTHEQQKIFAELFAMLVDIMDKQAENGEYCDFLGELFMWMGLGNDAGGQFFTPYDLCLAMARMTMDKDCLLAGIETNGYVSINDPACGAGATLIAAADIIRQWDINYQQTVIFTAQDIDYTTALMCYIQLSLLGCPGYVRIGNTLADPMTGPLLGYHLEDRAMWYTPMWFSDRIVLLQMRHGTETEKLPVATPAETRKPKTPVADMVEKKPSVKPEKPKEPEYTFVVRDDGQISMF